MGTIGNQTTPGLQFAITNDSYNGDGSTTAFTLSQSVSATTDIEVIVDNVQQSPHDGSYSVSGTTLTFSGAPSAGTNNIYVIYHGSKHHTTAQVIPDDGSVHSSKIASLAVTHAKLHTDMDLSTKNVNPITMSTGTNRMQMAIQSDVSNRFALRSTHTTLGDNNPFIIYQPAGAGHQNDALVIQSNGIVTQPKKPAFHVRLTDTGAQVQNPHGTHTVYENQGSHWNNSSHRFVAPVGGFYYFILSGYTNYAQGHGYIGIRKNGTQMHQGWHWNYAAGTMHGMGGMTAGLTLQTNDYVDFTRPSAGAGSHFSILNASGFLIG